MPILDIQHYKKKYELVFQYITPRWQTYYRLYNSRIAKVSKLKKIYKKIEVAAEWVSDTVGFASPLSYKYPQVAIATGITGSATYIVRTAARNERASLNQLKKNTKCVIKNLFQINQSKHIQLLTQDGYILFIQRQHNKKPLLKRPIIAAASSPMEGIGIKIIEEVCPSSTKLTISRLKTYSCQAFGKKIS